MSTAPAQKKEMVARLRELYPEAGVSYALPATFPNDCAYLGAVRVETSQPTEGGFRRSRRETASLQVIFSCYRPGLAADSNGGAFLDDEAGVRADEAAFQMLDALEDDFRTRGTDPLGGLVMTAIVSDFEADTQPVTDERGAIVGYVCELTATVTTTATI